VVLDSRARQAARDAEEAGEGPEHLGEAGDRHVFGARHAIEAELAHVFAADAETLDIGPQHLELAHQCGAVMIGRGFSGDDEDGRCHGVRAGR
jgi:hypothetical protein